MGKKSDLESVHLVNHSKCMLAAFQNFRQDETMLDVTLVCKGMSLKAHKLVLSACSPLFKDIISENPCAHPIIILREFEFSDLKAVIDFIYKGELSVPRERLMSALKVAEELNIRGLRRSEPNREKYEKLYSRVCGKLSSRKKRKRIRHDSSDSEVKEHFSVSDSDQNIVESEESLSVNDETPLESQPMDMESVNIANDSTNDKDIRPFVLRVGDPSSNDGEPLPENTYKDDECIISEKNSSDGNSQKDKTSQKEVIGEQSNEFTLETSESSLQFDSYAICSENSASLECVQEEEQDSFQEQNTEMSVMQSPEKIGMISPSSLSSQETHQSDEKNIQDSGKRFICPKCDSTFTSRISFMRHKTLCHNNTEKKNSYECKHCNFTAPELDSFKTHLLIHSNKVPYKCNLCPEEFTSEELYKQHLSLHEVEKTSVHCLLPTPEKDLFSMQNKNPEKITEYRCSICFLKFTSKLRCQIHEKSCQGGS